jgi:hypothetical protein
MWAAGALLLATAAFQQATQMLPDTHGLRRRLSIAAATTPSPPPVPQPSHRFLLFFSGHQGSSALADMLATHPSVFIPGFEPLDQAGLTAAQKTAFLEATFTFPASEAGFAAWRRELLPVAGMRVDQRQIRSFNQLAGNTVAGFKLRPYSKLDSPNMPGTGAGSGSSSDVNAISGGSTDTAPAPPAAPAAAAQPPAPGMYTALTGLSPVAFKALLQRYNVSVLLTLRHNTLKEALSWYKARELGVSQFTIRKHGRAAAAAGVDAGEGAAAEAEADEKAAGGQQQQTQQEQQAKQVQHAGKLTVDIPRVLHWLNYTARVNAQLRQAAAYYARPTLTVWYEELLADPLGQAQRAAAFVGVPDSGRGMQLSSKFRKAGPDGIQDWVQNFGVSLTWGVNSNTTCYAAAWNSCLPASSRAHCQLGAAAVLLQELCSALRGMPYFEHLDASACPPPGPGSATLPTAVQQQRAVARPDQQPGGGSSSNASTVAAQPGGQLLGNWCVPRDKEATGWAALSDRECMQRARAAQEAAAAAVRNGSGTLLFKHVHKVRPLAGKRMQRWSRNDCW